MRYLSVVVVFIALVLNIRPAAADGCYVPRLSLDPMSHSRDIAEPSQKAIICHFDGHEQLVIHVSFKGDVPGRSGSAVPAPDHRRTPIDTRRTSY